MPVALRRSFYQSAANSLLAEGEDGCLTTKMENDISDDALGRLTALAYSDGQNTTYSYDTLRVGALSSITGGGATLNYTYTPEGYVKTVSRVAK